MWHLPTQIRKHHDSKDFTKQGEEGPHPQDLRHPNIISPSRTDEHHRRKLMLAS